MEPVVRVILEDSIRQDIRPEVSVTASLPPCHAVLEGFFRDGPQFPCNVLLDGLWFRKSDPLDDAFELQEEKKITRG